MLLTKEAFGKDFIWGVSTAAYQIEGAHNLDGKGPSVWDTFVQKRNKIFRNHTGDTACDHYNRYIDDLYLMHSMNIRNYRFSISWSRILPEGTGLINQAGIDFYNRLIDLSLELGITPWVTLYHWDLPHNLEVKGGWTNRDVKDWFGDYVAICVKSFGDRVKNWMVLNEPTVFCAAGYFFGVHAPGRKSIEGFLAAAHHAALAQAHGARVIKTLQPESNVGTTFSCSHVEAYTNREKDIKAAKKADLLLNRLFIEPLLGMGYPVNEIKTLRRIEKYIKQNDERDLKFDMDFIGIQNYTREIIRYAMFVPFLHAKIVNAKDRNVEMTAMEWEVYPESIYHILKKFQAYENIPPLIITENGAAFSDTLQNNVVHDPKRLQYIQNILQQVLRAKQEGVNVNGYFVWTFLDNFEWAEGYHPRFGLVHVDFQTQHRIVKSSGHWYADFIK
ncbi:GH1 family beta-glucosidase [Elizabethkingia anophelis]|uniref:GH1 family beta-glucosidase n=1 Tax=Elizabethkingia anophelis TaxID=1117645 RepID=UPI0020115909|nr:GH1 family beta-glucosidase [Elizabethkingia anophelis]EJC8060099.1 beta-glucosidase [Elizabethkingia anophelis]MCL1643223.1 GH1 family beta-glucosidase [Elizabethkingia anophelis]MCL1643904.1 GH1 family beta-glucosidase [Elizabethkingia anophelis]MCT3926554.1 beta-glucosidase [Elizabethkingia anophelis]MCT4032700.1 beta-glucosidase [Elizabethkingia anophelis]